jgi:hypothetical protein
VGARRPAGLTLTRIPVPGTEVAAHRRRLPAAAIIAAIIPLALALLQVAVASLFVTRYDELVASVTAAMPGASPEQLGDRIFATTAEGIAVHAFLALVYAAAAIILRHPGASIRIFVTALALVATLSEGLILGQLPAILPAEASLILGSLGCGTVLRLLVIALLWLPASSRRWFSGKAAPV